MFREINIQDDLNHKENAKLVIDFIHRLMMHHAMWFFEVQKQHGQEEALITLDKVFDQSYGIQINRLAKELGFEMEEDIPKPLLNLSEQALRSLREKIAANWLANDGLWFQALEFSQGMRQAKLCNDACWASFSPMEAWSIKRFLNLPQQAGIEGLQKALSFRLYAAINKQSIEVESADSIVFKMLDCRVQSARKRKGLEDYPCKSAGVVEYTQFARSIDQRIKTECIGCPPDQHPPEWHCAWRFYTDRL